jgi:hypothetical protein
VIHLKEVEAADMSSESVSSYIVRHIGIDVYLLLTQISRCDSYQSGPHRNIFEIMVTFCNKIRILCVTYQCFVQ